MTSERKAMKEPQTSNSKVPSRCSPPSRKKSSLGLCAAKVLTFFAVELVVGAGAGPVDEALWIDSIVCLTNAGDGLFSVDRIGKQAGADPTVQYVFVWLGRGIGVEPDVAGGRDKFRLREAGCFTETGVVEIWSE